MNHYVELNLRRVRLGHKFNRTFSTNIMRFWHILTGFDIVKFDQWLKTPDGTSTKDYVTEKYGEDACKLIENLIE